MWHKKYRFPKDRTDVAGIVARTIQREADDGLFQGALIFDQAVVFTEKPEWKEFINAFEFQKRKDSGVGYIWCFVFLDEEHPTIFSNLSKYSWGAGTAIYMRRRVKEQTDIAIDENSLDRPVLAITAPGKSTNKFELLIGSLRHATIGLSTFGPMIQSMQELMRSDETEMKRIVAKERTRVPLFENNSFAMNFLDPKAAFSSQILKMVNRMLRENGGSKTKSKALTEMHDALLKRPIKKLVDKFLAENNRRDDYIIIDIGAESPGMIRFDMDWKVLPNGDLCGSNASDISYTFSRETYHSHEHTYLTIRELTMGKIQVGIGTPDYHISEQSQFGIIYAAWYRAVTRIHEAEYQVARPSSYYENHIFMDQASANDAVRGAIVRLRSAKSYLEKASDNFFECFAAQLPNNFDIESVKG